MKFSVVVTICVVLSTSEGHVLRKREYGSAGNQGSTYGAVMPGAPGSIGIAYVPGAGEILYYNIGNIGGNNGGVGAEHIAGGGGGA